MDYEEMKRKKLEELQEKKEEEARVLEAEAKIASLAKNLLTEEARARLNNVGLVNKELYLKTVQAVLYLQRAGQLQGKLGEKEVKALLEKLSNKREITIKRK